MADITEGIRAIIQWPDNLPNTRTVKVAGLEELVINSLRRALRDIMK